MSSSGLDRTLERRHITMITFGGMLGAGWFVGTGAAIEIAGPGIIVAVVACGLLMFFLMRMLGELAMENPDAGSFSSYADRVLGRWAGATVGWLYWWFWVIIVTFEATAGAVIISTWVPELPQWLVAFVLMTLLTITNLWSVGTYGEFEFWFAFLKVAAVVLFILVGALVLAGLFPGTASPGLSNLNGHGGFFPNGFGAVLSAVLIVFFSFTGPEIVTIAAAESREPGKAIARATFSIIWRISIFFVASISLVVAIVPWDSPEIVEDGPYVAMLRAIDISFAADLMAVIVLVAVLSALNSGLYTASRMVYSLAGRGLAPRRLGEIDERRVPRWAILASVSVGFVGVVFNFIAPGAILTFLLNSGSSMALFVYVAIGITQIVSRYRLRWERGRGAERALPIRMWLFPGLSILTVAAMVSVIVLMLFDDAARSQIISALAVAAVVVTLSLIFTRNDDDEVQRRRAPETSRIEEGS